MDITHFSQEDVWNAYKDAAFAIVKATGAKVSEENALARLEVCKGCEFRGMVTPLPGITVEGCTQCGCPFQTKAYMKTFKFQKVKCTHPEGNKWEMVDNNF